MRILVKLIIVVLVIAAACMAAYSAAVSGPSVADTIRLSNGPALNHPGPIAVNPADGAVFVASNDGGNVVRYNPSTKLIEGEITGLVYPEALAVHAGDVYVASFDPSMNAGIYVYSAQTMAKVKTIPSLGWYIYSMRIDPDSQTLYYGTANRAFKVNLADNTQEELLDLRSAIPEAAYAFGSSVNFDKQRGRLYITCAYYKGDWSMHAAVVAYDLASKQVTSTVQIGQNPAGFDYRYDAALDGDYLFVTQMYASAITVVNVANASVAAVMADVTWPQKLAVNNAKHRLYVVDNYTDKFHVIDTQALRLIKSFCPGDDPSGVCVDEARDRVYAANHWSQDIAVVSSGTEELIERVPFVPATPLDALVSGGKLYVSNGPNGGMFIIDPASNRVTDRVLPFSYAAYYNDLSMPSGMLNVFTGEIAVLGQLAYTTDEYNQSVAVFDLAAKKFQSHIGAGSFPSSVARSGSKVYFPFCSGGNIYLGITDGTSTSDILLGESSAVGGVAINSATGKAYVADYANNRVAVVDLSANSLIEWINVGYFPAGIAVDENRNMVYVACYGSDSVALIDGRTGSMRGYLVVGSGPWGIEARPDTGRVYVVNSGDNSLSVIDASNTPDWRVIAKLPVGSGAKYCGINPGLNRVYVPNQLDGTITVIEDDAGGTPPPPPPPPADPAKAAIKNPKDGKRICGNAVTVFAEIVQGSASGVLFQYKKKNSTEWTDIEEKDVKKPFHVYWNTRELSNGEYKLRAVAYNSDNTPDPQPGFITVYIDGNDPDIVEDNDDNGGCHRKAEKVSAGAASDIQLGDGTKACVPAGAISKATFLIIETVENAPVPAEGSVLKSLGTFRRYEFADGTRFFSQPIQISLPYSDEDGDGLIDGAGVSPYDVEIMYFDEQRQEWRGVADGKASKSISMGSEARGLAGTVSVNTDHFTLFGLFYKAANKDLSNIMIYPNPFRPYRGNTTITFDGMTGGAKITVYTVSGRQVREMEADADGKYEWDATASGGEKLASGVYIYCVTNNKGQKAIGKFAVIR